MSLSDNNQADVVEAFNSTSRYLDDLFNIDNPYFAQMLGQIYPTELQLNKANPSDTKAHFLDLDLSTIKFMINGTTLIFNFLMEMFLAPLPMVYTFRNLFVLQEYVLILMTSTIQTNF